MESVKIVQDYYDEDVEREWERLERHPFEFALTCRFLDRYLHPGDRVLDIGGGPGRYSLHLAQRGCQVTLLDLSSGNTAFAAQKAREQGLSLSVVTGDAREASRLVEGTFDHVLLMGPLYHLTEKADREQCLREALSLLREGGTLSMSFINLPSGLIYALREEPEQLLWQKPDDLRYLQNLREGGGLPGPGLHLGLFYPAGEHSLLCGGIPPWRFCTFSARRESPPITRTAFWKSPGRCRKRCWICARPSVKRRRTGAGRSI